jgi:hypothetical protein
MAFMCSLIYSFWCESFELSPVVAAGDSLKFGPWYQRDTDLVEVGIGGGDELYYKEVTTCVTMDIDVDSHWKTVRAFTVLAPLWGGLLTAVLWFAPCLYFLSPGQWYAVALQFSVVITLFQGLTFLLFRSDLCDDVSLLNNYNAAAYKPGCQWDQGSTANVFSIVLWFMAGVVMVAVGVPVRAPREPPQTQAVTYQKTNNADGTTTVSEVAVVKGTAVPTPPKEMPAAEPETA